MCAYKKKMQKTKINLCLQISQLLLLFFITLGISTSIVGGLEGTRTSNHWRTHQKPGQLIYLSGFKSINY